MSTLMTFDPTKANKDRRDNTHDEINKKLIIESQMKSLKAETDKIISKHDQLVSEQTSITNKFAQIKRHLHYTYDYTNKMSFKSKTNKEEKKQPTKLLVS